jgi:hypothetical protein
MLSQREREDLAEECKNEVEIVIKLNGRKLAWHVFQVDDFAASGLSDVEYRGIFGNLEETLRVITGECLADMG